MNYDFLLYSFLLAVVALVWYKFNKWSLKDRNGIKILMNILNLAQMFKFLIVGL